MTFKEFIENLTPYTFVYIRFESDTFIYDKNYVAKFKFNHRYDDCEVLENKANENLDYHIVLRKS